MDVIVSAKLSCIVVPPRVDVVLFVYCRDVASTELQMAHWVLKCCLNGRRVDSRSEKGREALDSPDSFRHSLILLDEAVSCARTERPSPEKHLVALIYQS